MANKQTIVDQLIKNNLSLSSFDYEMKKYGVEVVKPGDHTNMTFYTDQRRFFPETNDEDIVIGGYFG